MSSSSGASASARTPAALHVAGLYHRLRDVLGPREHWWPVETRTEILLGSVLVQNTNWRNADRSLTALRDAGLLDLDKLLAVPDVELVELIRPSGFQSAKARAIRGLALWATACRRGRPSSAAAGGDSTRPTAPSSWLGPALVGSVPTSGLRTDLLAIPGVGPETADVVLLYVFERPVFIADSYARRLFTRLGATVPRRYDDLARLASAQTDFTVAQWQEFHALIDDYAKVYCRNDASWSEGPLHGTRMILPIPRIPGWDKGELASN